MIPLSWLSDDMVEDRSIQPSTAPVAARRCDHSGEPHADSLGSRLNWLRAGVLGANDGIVSVAGLVVGVAGATIERAPIVTAGRPGSSPARWRWRWVNTCRSAPNATPNSPNSPEKSANCVRRPRLNSLSSPRSI